MNAALGQFADGFNGFRRMLAAVPQGSRLLLFQNACKEAAVYVGKGLDRVVAADELTDMAVANGLDDAEVVQFCISQAFVHIREPDQFPDDDDPEPEQKPNGKGNGKDHNQRARTYLLPDPATIPPREWLYRPALHARRRHRDGRSWRLRQNLTLALRSARNGQDRAARLVHQRRR